MGRHYLIGHGERLSEPIVLPRGGATPKDIYTYEESRARLQPELHSAIANLPDDPALAPNDVHVLQMVLHPKYLAKSYHPSGLLRAAGLSLVGSKPVRITTADDPDKGARLSRTLLVAGHRQSLEHFDSLLQDPTFDVKSTQVSRTSSESSVSTTTHSMTSIIPRLPMTHGTNWFSMSWTRIWRQIIPRSSWSSRKGSE